MFNLNNYFNLVDLYFFIKNIKYFVNIVNVRVTL